jgi:hypothetical protein
MSIGDESAEADLVPAAIYEVELLGAITIVDVKVGEQILKIQLPASPGFWKANLCVSASISMVPPVRQWF